MHRPSPRPLLALLLCVLAAGFAAGASASDIPSYDITLRDHRFEPARITIPAGRKVLLVVHNRDATPEEFESNDFNREKLIPGGRSARIYVGPLKAGSYRFFGEFHADSAQGVLVVED